MRNRERQRANRRKYGEKRRYEKPWQNAEGYTDLTAYHGIKNAMKDKAAPRPEVGASKS